MNASAAALQPLQCRVSRGSAARSADANPDLWRTPMNVIDTRMPALLRGSRPLLGMFVGPPAPALVEMCGHAGVDFVIIDNEHGSSSIESTEHLLRAARGAGVVPIVRTLEGDI